MRIATDQPSVLLRLLLPGLFFVTLLCCLSLGANAAKAATKEFFVHEATFNCNIYLLEAGQQHQEQSIILVHGLGDRATRTWATLIPQLAREYHVVAFDLPGFGRSDAPNALYSPENYAKLLAWIVKQYARPKHSVIGHSLGGAIALMYAASQPQGLQKLILADVAGILHRSSVMTNFLQPKIRQQVPAFPSGLSDAIDNLVGSATHLASDLPLDTGQILQTPLLRKILLGGKPAKIAALALVETDYSPVVFAPHCPTLLVWGETDRVAPLRVAHLLNTTIENSRLKLIKQAGHVPMKENFTAFQTAVMSFLKQKAPNPTKLVGEKKENFVASNLADRVISGHYGRIELINCQRITLRNLQAEQIRLERSSVALEEVAIAGETTGLELQQANVIASGVRIAAPQAIVSRQSKADLAGLDIMGGKPIDSDPQSYLLFSASRIRNGKAVKYLHGVWQP